MPEPLAGALAVVATYALHSTAILGLTWLVLRRARLEPVVRARAWKLALVGGFATAALQSASGLRPLGGLLELDVTAGAASRTALAGPLEVPLGPLATGAEAPPSEGPSSEGPSSEAALPTVVLAPLADAVRPDPRGVDPLAIQGAVDRPAAWRRALTWTWVAGAAYGLALVALRRGRFRSRVRDRLPVWDARAEGLLRDLARRAGLRRPVRLSRSRSLRVPATWGWWRPEICLPDRALVELARDELEAVLAHELGHVARGDALWLTLGQCLDALCFFQPLNRVARRGLARESEHLADAFAVSLTGRPVSLARALARVATWLDPRRERAEPAVATMAASRSALLERVERVLARAPRRRATLGPSLAFLALPCLALTAVPGVAAAGASERAGAGRAPERGSLDEALAPTAGAALERRLEELTLVADEHIDAAPAPLATDADGRATAVALVRAELAVLENELRGLRRDPRGTEHADALDALSERLERLDALTARAAELARAATPNTGEASAGRPVPAVPPHSTPDEEQP